MASEAQFLNRSLEELDVRQVTVADGTQISKGSLLVLSSDPNTATKHSAESQVPLGITTTEKVANDGATVVGVLVRGDVDMVAEVAITLGHLVIPGATANQVIGITSESISNSTLRFILGQCLETASAGARVRIRLRLG